MRGVALALLGLLSSAHAQPCLTCRTERCPSKPGLAEWCGAGRDPLARPTKPETPRAPICGSGQVVVDGHCCAVGQRWSRAESTCVAPPPAAPPPLARPEPSAKPISCGEGEELIAALSASAAFCMQRTEVTVRAYSTCIQQGGCTPAAEGAFCNSQRRDRLDHPINCLSFAQAEAYCHSLGERLPSDEEWIRAARSAGQTAPFPWGDAPPSAQVCWSGGDQDWPQQIREGTCATGTHPDGASRQGILDLAGNVAEWTSSRSIRGGSWGTFHPVLLRSDRGVSQPDDLQSAYVGVRCVHTP